MSDCTYTFRGPDGRDVTLTGQAEIKAFLANGGEAYLRGDVQSNTGPLATLFSRDRGWEGFPDAVIATPLSTQSKDVDYAAAKGGDTLAAGRLVDRILPTDAVTKVKAMIGDSDPIVVAVHAEEAAGQNKIPLAVAEKLGEELGLRVDDAVVQASRSKRTGSDGMARIGVQPEFKGAVESGADYLLVDDTLTQGGTLAQLKTYIERNGGRVVGAFALSGKQYSAKLAIDAQTLADVRSKYGRLEDWWRSELGYGFAGLTQSEARYILKSGLSADALRDRIASARQEARVSSPTGVASRPSERRSTDRSSYLGDLTPEQEAAARRVGSIKPQKTRAERIAEFKNGLGLRLRQGIADQFAAIKTVSDKAYIQARMSKGSDGALEAQMLYGPVFLRDGVPDVKIEREGGGFAKALGALDGEHDRFLLWVAAQRAERLKSEGKENLFTDEDISALKTLNEGDAKHPERKVKFETALRELNRYNDAALKVAFESGLIDEAALKLFKDQPYVPFYRVMEDEGGVTGPSFSAGLTSQYAFKKLKGGSNQLNQDLLSNVLLNWSHLFAASARNRAAKMTMDAAVDKGIALQVDAGTKGAVKIMRDGKTEHYLIDDPQVFEALSALEYSTPAYMKSLSTVKRWLTMGVTANPAFKIRNLIRDSLSAIAQNDLDYNVLSNVAKGYKATAKDSQTYASMLASGGVLRFGSMLEGDRAHRAHRIIADAAAEGTLLDESGWKTFQRKLGDVIEAYNELGDRSENVNRAALYEQLIAKGYNHADASFMARDMLDFSMQGRYGAIRFLSQSVPFFNARIQGLYKLGRSAAADPQRFATVATAVAMASLALWMAYRDDDDWKKREDWDRDNYWWFKIGGVAFRIPKPFEVGSIGTAAERTAELFFDDEMTGSRYGKRFSDMLLSTFAMNPIPQLFKPFYDIYANKDAFSGRPIESMGMERLRPQDRFNERTSSAAKFLGQLGLPNPVDLAMARYEPLSPVQIDSLVRAYFGWIGTTIVAASDMVVKPMTEDTGPRPEAKLRDYFLIGNFAETLPAGTSRYVTEMYNQAVDIEQAYASYREAIKRGDPEDARSIYEDNMERLAKRGVFSDAKTSMSDLNTMARKISTSPTMSAEEKRQRLDAIDAMKNDIARRAVSR